MLYFLLNEQPSVRRALPPVGWQRTVAQEPQMTTVWACEKTVVMLKHPGHLTSMKNERGAGTKVCKLANFCQISNLLVYLIRYGVVPWACACEPRRRERGWEDLQREPRDKKISLAPFVIFFLKKINPASGHPSGENCVSKSYVGWL